MISILSVIAAAASVAQAAPLDAIRAGLRSELSKRFPGARIELSGEIRWVSDMAEIGAVSIQTITPRGEVYFSVSSQPVVEGRVSFAAYAPAYIAKRRILPGENTAPEMFSTQEINVAAGNAYEFRGLIFPANIPVSGLEARQTILEGQFLTSAAVQKLPDIRRGDSVRIELISGGLTVHTMGTAEEPAYLKGRIRVVAIKSKREFVGELSAPGMVEVKL